MECGELAQDARKENTSQHLCICHIVPLQVVSHVRLSPVSRSGSLSLRRDLVGYFSSGFVGSLQSRRGPCSFTFWLLARRRMAMPAHPHAPCVGRCAPDPAYMIALWLVEVSSHAARTVAGQVPRTQRPTRSFDHDARHVTRQSFQCFCAWNRFSYRGCMSYDYSMSML